MTCIAGIAQDGKVYIGADSISSNGWTRGITAQRKVFRVGELLIGACGSIRASNLLQQSLSVRAIEENESAEHYLIEGAIEAVRALLKTRGVARVENNVEAGETFLIGFRGQLFRVDTDFQIDTYLNGLAACGAGKDYALAALLALTDKPPVERIQRALEISAECCALIAPPFYVESIG